MNVRAVLFDLDGTLYAQRPLRLLMAAELTTLPLTGFRLAGKRLQALRAFRKAQETLRNAGQAAGPTAQLEAAAAASGLTVAEVSALVDEWMMRRPLKYLRWCRAGGLTRLLDLLESRGIRTGILSDYPAESKIRALGLAGRFSPVLTAADPEVGVFKPHPRGFERACEVWGLAPSEVLYVGDRPEVDAEGAAAAGMRCVIVGRQEPQGASYRVVPSFERLCRELERQ